MWPNINQIPPRVEIESVRWCRPLFSANLFSAGRGLFIWEESYLLCSPLRKYCKHIACGDGYKILLVEIGTKYCLWTKRYLLPAGEILTHQPMGSQSYSLPKCGYWEEILNRLSEHLCILGIPYPAREGLVVANLPWGVLVTVVQV